MPYSSGGGSHRSGGSSHSSGGGSHSGGSHHSSRPQYSTHDYAFPGSHGYFYYKHRRPVYYYTDRPEGEHEGTFGCIIAICVSIVFILSGLNALRNSIDIHSRLYGSYDTSIVISDNADIFTSDEESALETALNDFYDKTGAVPAIWTVNNEDWESYYDGLENYAYDIYVNNFDDEYHWLIVYSEPEVVDSKFNDWYFEGMQGNYTGSIITYSVADEFNDSLTEALTASSKYTVAEAFIKAFNVGAKSSGSIDIDFESLLGGLLSIGIFSLVLLSAIGDYSNAKNFSKSVRVPDGTKPVEVKCAYCGGVYVQGTCTECPHCGAPVL